MNTIDDIEIYVKNLPLAEIKAWLEACFGQLNVITTGKAVHDMAVIFGNSTIEVMIIENAVGKAWTSIWFKNAGTPWGDDTECARNIHSYSQCQVRCNSGPWQEGADMDEWWQLDENGDESLIKWPNAN